MSAFSPQSSELGPVVIGGITILILVAAGFAALSNDLFESNSIASLNEERAVRISNQKAKISRLENDIVAQNDRFSSSRSVPGSLETWEARAIRFQKAAGHYRIKLNEALTQVRTLEPSFKRPK